MFWKALGIMERCTEKSGMWPPTRRFQARVSGGRKPAQKGGEQGVERQGSWMRSLHVPHWPFSAVGANPMGEDGPDLLPFPVASSLAVRLCSSSYQEMELISPPLGSEVALGLALTTNSMCWKDSVPAPSLGLNKSCPLPLSLFLSDPCDCHVFKSGLFHGG